MSDLRPDERTRDAAAPLIGRATRRRRLRRALGVPALLAAATCFALARCGDSGDGGRGGGPAGGRAAPSPAKAAKASWTPDEMAADPEGYLLWADQNLERQIATRRERISAVAARRGDLEGRRAGFGTNLDELRNVETRLAAALRKAEDEDRFPFKMAGHTFTREKAQSVLTELARLLADRGPLAQTYAEGIAKLAAIESSLTADIERLRALRDKLAIDLEQVRVSHGVAELEKLRSTESEIAHYAKILGSLAEETTGALPAAPPPVDLNQLLQ
ncbi:MAG: hypothetical protein FJ293_14855 [Planctomycetes bacterium]|nr:hypothetical protein [Planctomycetota bacterium]